MQQPMMQQPMMPMMMGQMSQQPIPIGIFANATPPSTPAIEATATPSTPVTQIPGVVVTVSDATQVQNNRCCCHCDCQPGSIDIY